MNIGKSQIAVTAVDSKKDSNATPDSGNLPRSGRLLRHADFERVYKRGRRHFSKSMTVFYLSRALPEGELQRSKKPRTERSSGVRVGFTVTRALGGAVERNRMKRRLREAVRLTRAPAGLNVDIVINPKKSVLMAEFSSLCNEIARAFAVLEENSKGKSQHNQVDKS